MSTYIKINVTGNLSKMEKEMRQIMDEIACFISPFSRVNQTWLPATDVYEDRSFIYIVVELPGIKHESIEVCLDGRWLQIRGERQSPIHLEHKRYYQMEIEYGPFQRIVRIPERVNLHDITARYEDGILIVQLGKHDSERPVKIDVK